MCELDKKKLGKMIDSVLKGELVLYESPDKKRKYFRKDKKLKKEIEEINHQMFEALCKAYNNTVEFVEQPIIVQAPILRLPPTPPMPPITITKTVTTTTTFKNIPTGKLSFAECIKEMKASMEKGEKLTIGKYTDDLELGIKSKEEIQLILDANEMVLARD